MTISGSSGASARADMREAEESGPSDGWARNALIYIVVLISAQPLL